MRVSLDAYAGAHKGLARRAAIQLVLGGVVFVGASFAAFLGLLLLLVPEGDLWSRRSGVFVLVFVGLFPLAGASAVLYRGVTGVIRVRRLRELAALVRARPQITSRDLPEALGLSSLDAERLVLDAASLGLVTDGPAGAQAPPGLPGQPAQAALPAALPAATAAPFSPTVPDGNTPRLQAPRRAPADWAGTVVGGSYRIEGLIGSGGMGAVYAARHVRTGRRYAIKTLLPDARVSPEAIRRFEREATAASSLGHPGIVAVHDFAETEGGVHYLVMDLLEGETLEQRLERQGSLPWPEARRVLLEVGSALSSAHAAGLLHRDLKPANIFLARAQGAPERAVLLDFGLAKPLDEGAVSRLTSTGSAVGTPLYMSPEQARGEVLDVRSDVYGLGAVLFEMLTGAPPFLDRTLAAVYTRLLTEAVPPASTLARMPLPPECDALLARALARSRDERFASVEALLEAASQVGAQAAGAPWARAW